MTQLFRYTQILEISRTSSLPMIITFLKKNNAIYVLIMSVNKQVIHLKPELMYDLIKGRYN